MVNKKGHPRLIRATGGVAKSKDPRYWSDELESVAFLDGHLRWYGAVFNREWGMVSWDVGFVLSVLKSASLNIVRPSYPIAFLRKSLGIWDRARTPANPAVCANLLSVVRSRREAKALPVRASAATPSSHRTTHCNCSDPAFALPGNPGCVMVGSSGPGFMEITA